MDTNIPPVYPPEKNPEPPKAPASDPIQKTEKQVELPKNQTIEGFGDLMQASVYFTAKNIGKYLLLTLSLVVPAVMVIGILGFLFVSGTGYSRAQDGSYPQKPTAVTEEMEVETTDAAMEELGQFIDENLESDLEGMDDWEDWGTEWESMSDTEAMDLDYSAMSIGKAGIGFGIGLALFFILVQLYTFFVWLSLTRLTCILEKNLPWEGYGSIIKWSYKKLGSYIMLMLRIFVYSYIWAPIALIIAGGIISTMVGEKNVINVILLVGTIALGIIATIRMVRVMFCQFILVDKDCTSKEALDIGVSLSMGNWWRMIGYACLMGFAIFVAAMVNAFIVGLISETLAAITNILIQVFASYLGVVFYLKFYHMIEAEKK